MFGEAWSPMSVPDLAPDDDECPTGVDSIDLSLLKPLALSCITNNNVQYLSIYEQNKVNIVNHTTVKSCFQLHAFTRWFFFLPE